MKSIKEMKLTVMHLESEQVKLDDDIQTMSEYVSKLKRRRELNAWSMEIVRDSLAEY